MEECLMVYGIAFMLFLVSVIFIIMTLNLQKEVRSKNLLNIYDIKKNETVTTITDIRKNDGTSCNLSYIYEDGKSINTQSGGACK